VGIQNRYAALELILAPSYPGADISALFSGYSLLPTAHHSRLSKTREKNPLASGFLRRFVPKELNFTQVTLANAGAGYTLMGLYLR
jgi:hypothetical protein